MICDEGDTSAKNLWQIRIKILIGFCTTYICIYILHGHNLWNLCLVIFHDSICLWSVHNVHHCADAAAWQGHKILIQLILSTTACVNWVVEAKPPRSRVRTFRSSRTLLTAAFTLRASTLRPRCSSILALASNKAVGLATLRPAKETAKKISTMYSQAWI